MQMIESTRPVAASFFAASAISSEPGTRTISICFSSAPACSSASSAPASSRSVMKLLKRLTTMPMRSPAALNWPRVTCGFSVIVVYLVCSSSVSSASASLEFCRPLFEEGAGAFAHVFGGAADAEERCFEKQAFFERHVHAVLDCFHCVFHGEGRVGDDFPCDGFGGGQKFGWLHDAIHQADSQRFVGRNHFAGENQLVRDAFAAESRQALRAAETRQQAEFCFRLADFCILARDAHCAAERKLAASSEREAVDCCNGRLAHGFEAMEHAIAEDGEFFTCHRSARGELVDVCSGDECFFAGAGENAYADRIIALDGGEAIVKFFDRFAIERVEHVRAIERDAGDLVFHVVE